MISIERALRDRLEIVGERAKQLRLLRELDQVGLAERAGLGVATIRRFEKTGFASLPNVLRIAHALQAEAGFDRLFEAPPYASLDEALARDQPPGRQRAPRRPR